MRRRLYYMVAFIVALTAAAFWINFGQDPQIKLGSWEKQFRLVQGLDLKGGTQLTYELDLSKIDKDKQSQAQDSVLNVLDKRINSLGVTEPVITTSKLNGKPAVVVELPGITDSNQASKVIGKTAQLVFKEEDGTDESGQPKWKETGLTGAQLSKATTDFDPQTSKPIIGLEFNGEGDKLFGEITERNINKPLAIFLDDELLQAPNVNGKITGGKATITGTFTLDEVRNTVNLLNSGALPVPMALAQQKNIGATLGDESIKRSLVAGMVGLGAVALFMISYYRFLGIVAVVALTIYTLISFAVFKTIPVTLTLAGIAGFILSIGMAVDANILIFERMKEELRAGKSVQLAITEGFKRAWTSIRDSNISSIMTAFILFEMTVGPVKGFALTLILGILVSMFTAITVSRTLLNLLAMTKASRWLTGGIK